jgi:hypothetical protein
MNDHLNLVNARARATELHRQAEMWRLGHLPEANGRTQRSDGAGTLATGSGPSTLVIRMAGTRDGAPLARLAQLDGQPGPEPARLLVAEVEGEVLAALPLDGGRPLADPFRPTASFVEMLMLRAAQLRGAPPRRGLRGWLSRLLGAGAHSRPATAPATPGNAGMLIPRD